MARHAVRILAEGNSNAFGGVLNSDTGLVKSIDWKQGMIIAMGVPILILPGIYDIAGTAWGLSHRRDGRGSGDARYRWVCPEGFH